MSKLNLKPEERIILALDFPDFKESKSWFERLKGKVKIFKVGPILFLNSGPMGLKEFIENGAGIFLDLKFHDIPSTVEKAVKQIVDFGICMFTVHALGGFQMMKTVVETVNLQSKKSSKPNPLILAVTILTSHDEESLRELGMKGSCRDSVLRLAQLAERAGVGGLVCSGLEAEFLRREFGDRFTLIVPGVRINANIQDQKRVTTPREALAKGADYLVIGRAITESKNPEAALNDIIRSIT